MLSIVIPALNEERLLPHCLYSLRSQDYGGEYEIVVADNGSTDSTADIARSHGVRVVSCPENRSVFYARQVGADAATGDIIIQADADTMYPPDWLRRIAERFAADPKVVAVSGRFAYMDPPSWEKTEYSVRHAINRLTARLFGRPFLVSGATFAFRRSAFLKVGGYHGISYSADQYGIADRLRKAGKVIYDGSICVFTSSRSVSKPFAAVLADVATHINRWGVYFGKCCLNASREYAGATRGRRVAFKLLPVVLLFLAFIISGYFMPASPVFGKVYYKGDSSERVAALTFDDGPNDPYTSQILDILGHYGIQATFFVIGKNVELYPKTARRMLDEGHVLGNHSYSHDANHALSQYGGRDMAKAQVAIFNVTGVTPHLYRPPHGKKTPWELQAVKKLNLIEVTWSVSTGELNTKDPLSVARKIVNKTDPEEIILLHDGYGTEHDNTRSDKSLTVKALPIIIDQLLAKGYKFVTVSELLSVRAYND